MDDVQKHLNERQKEAVATTRGAVLVIAGPGSGKTRVIEYRVLRLVQEGVDPKKILLLTFTKHAAREMLKRAASHDPRCASIEGGTFHSFAYKILRQYGGKLGLSRNLSVLDEGDAEELIGKIVATSGLSAKRESFPKKDTVKKIFSLSINKGLTLQETVERYFSHLSDFLGDFESIKQRYAEQKRENGYLDFDDLLLCAKDILSLGDVGKKIASAYEFIMVDEYQDTNPIQGEITRLLGQESGNILVVGDDAQSIYGFRGASHKNIMEFPKMFPGTKIIKLEENYRSTQPILDFSNEILLNMEEKFQKNLFSAKRKEGDRPSLIYFNGSGDAAEWMTEKIFQSLREGGKLRDHAVLFRSTYVSIPLQAELARMKIPYQVFGGMRFYETAHVKDLLAYLKVVANLKDEISWGRILTMLPGIGKKTAESVWLGIKARDDFKQSLNFLEEVGVRGKSTENFLRLKKTLSDIDDSRGDVYAAIDAILRFYLPFFQEKFDDWPARLPDLEVMKALASHYEDLDSFLADVSLDIPHEGPDGEKEFLTLSTIHSAKGLEWKTVYLLGVAEGILPSKKSMDFPEDIEEESRLLYVAVTRAKEHLYLFFPWEEGRGMYLGNRISRFLEPSNVFSVLNHEDLSGYGLKEKAKYSEENEGIEYE